MKKEIVAKYIQFAIDNGYKEIKTQFNGAEGDSIYLLTDLGPTTISIYGVITSKEFIEAIARGLVKKLKGKSIEGLFGYGAWVFGDNIDDFNQELEEITINQAIAIRDGKLEEFIKQLINPL